MYYSHYNEMTKNDLKNAKVSHKLLSYSLDLLDKYDGAYLPKPAISWAYQKEIINEQGFRFLFDWTRQFNPSFADYGDVTGKQLHYRKTLIAKIQEALQLWSEGKPVYSLLQPEQVEMLTNKQQRERKTAARKRFYEERKRRNKGK